MSETTTPDLNELMISHKIRIQPSIKDDLWLALAQDNESAPVYGNTPLEAAMKAAGGAYAVDFPRPNKVVLFFEGDGYALCPYCEGQGITPTAATTVVEWCRHCGGRGKVRAF